MRKIQARIISTLLEVFGIPISSWPLFELVVMPVVVLDFSVVGNSVEEPPVVGQNIADMKEIVYLFSV